MAAMGATLTFVVLINLMSYIKNYYFVKSIQFCIFYIEYIDLL